MDENSNIDLEKILSVFEIPHIQDPELKKNVESLRVVFSKFLTNIWTNSMTYYSKIGFFLDRNQNKTFVEILKEMDKEFPFKDWNRAWNKNLLKYFNKVGEIFNLIIQQLPSSNSIFHKVWYVLCLCLSPISNYFKEQKNKIDSQRITHKYVSNIYKIRGDVVAVKLCNKNIFGLAKYPCIVDEVENFQKNGGQSAELEKAHMYIQKLKSYQNDFLNITEALKKIATNNNVTLKNYEIR